MIIKNAYGEYNKYREFVWYSVLSEMKVQLSSTFFGYLWWLLDPLMYMMVYMLVFGIIFQRGGENYHLFIFCALLPWKWTTSSIMDATKSVKSRASFLHQVYFPKYLLPLIKCLINTTKYMFGTLTLLVLLIIGRTPITLHWLEYLLIFVVHFLFILSVSFLLAHLGVYFKDISNILTFMIRLWFYLSPALYSLEDIPVEFRFIWWVNPMTTFFQSYRNVFIYGESPYYLGLFFWLISGFVASYSGLKLLIRHDRNYTKVI